MQDFSIKDKCDRCGGTEDLDGVLFPSFNEETNTVTVDQETLCKPCRTKLENPPEEPIE